MSRGARIPVVFLAGGRSPEHEISLRSARELLRVVDRDRWLPHAVRLDRDSVAWWVRPAGDDGRSDGDPFVDGEWVAMPPGVAIEHLRAECGVRIAFPALHGPLGEDGTIQGFLEFVGMPYVGSGVAASAAAIDKVRTRECFACAGVPMPRACVGEWPAGDEALGREVARVGDTVGYPGFAKVDCSGSSIGVRAVGGPAELVEFFRESGGAGRRYLVEEAVEGEEISVPVLGNTGDVLEALPPVGIYPVVDEYFTFEAKYTEAATEEIVPPRGLDAAGLDFVMDLAIRCHAALRCDGMSRTDMIVGRDGPVVLEINTIPGFTAQSLFPKSAAHVGISFRELVDRFFESAARRWGLAP